MIVEDQPAWAPHLRSRSRLRSIAKRHFVDPFLAVVALGATLEVDAVIECADGRWGALEIKLGAGMVEQAAASLLKFVATNQLEEEYAVKLRRGSYPLEHYTLPNHTLNGPQESKADLTPQPRAHLSQSAGDRIEIAGLSHSLIDIPDSKGILTRIWWQEKQYSPLLF
jgi:hypothetical protein